MSHDVRMTILFALLLFGFPIVGIAQGDGGENQISDRMGDPIREDSPEEETILEGMGQGPEQSGDDVVEEFESEVEELSDFENEDQNLETRNEKPDASSPELSEETEPSDSMGSENSARESGDEEVRENTPLEEGGNFREINARENNPGEFSEDFSEESEGPRSRMKGSGRSEDYERRNNQPPGTQKSRESLDANSPSGSTSLGGNVDRAQESGSNSSASDTEQSSAKQVDSKEQERKAEEDRKRRQIKRKEYCAMYDGKIISYYGETYRVKNCFRQPVASTELFSLVSKGARVTEVEGDVINLIDLKTPPVLSKTQDICSELDKQYVTLDHDTVYLVVNCKKRKFPDWVSFNDHRYKKGIKSVSIREIDWETLNAIPDGEGFVSVLDEDYVRAIDPKVDVIPIDEACKGLEGKFVSYYSRVYKIERCYKRPVNPIEFSKLFSKGRVAGADKVNELSSEQWISLPLGKPFAF